MRTAGLQSTKQVTTTSSGSLRATGHYPRVAVWFLVCLCLPVVFHLGTLRLTPYRVFLLVALFPMVVAWLAGRAGRYTACDVLVFLHVGWVALAMFVLHGSSEVLEPVGIYAVEALGAYFIGRVFIRSADHLRGLTLAWVLILILFIPFVAFESITGRHILIEDVFGAIFPTIGTFEMQPRWGLSRALGVFEHPILYGVFCASVFALAWYLVPRRRNPVLSSLAVTPVFATTFFSLSAGPLTALTVQLVLIVWDYITRWLPMRWLVLIALTVTAYILVDLVSQRSPVEVFISYFTFNAGNAWNRIHIWNFGTAEVLRQPIFGIGLNDWIRAHWMSGSMDNFWLVVAVRYGLPSFIFLALAVIITVVQASTRPLEHENERLARRAWIITIIGLAIIGATVHFWNQVFCCFLLILGSGNWLVRRESKSEM